MQESGAELHIECSSIAGDCVGCCVWCVAHVECKGG